MSLNRTNRPSGDDLAVPASVGNIGSGFDTLAVALRLYLRLRVVDIRDDGAATLTVVKSTPPVAGKNAVERAYQAIARWTGLKAPSVFVEAESDIPMTAGLGSSAAAAVAGLRMFERVTQPLPEGVLLAVATSLEGHADNAAAALHGGLTSVVEREGHEPVALRWQWPEDLRFVIATPSVGLSTSKARAALPDSLPRRDAVFNLQRVLSLVHALQSGEYDRLRESVRDRWHQRARAALVPQLGEVLALEDPAILASFLSGAGPSVALVARGDFERLEQLLASTYERAACPVRIRTLAVHQSSDVARETVASAPGRNR
ncbi:MAG: homoserine kinase [Vicinamibacterales bacterium]